MTRTFLGGDMERLILTGWIVGGWLLVAVIVGIVFGCFATQRPINEIWSKPKKTRR
jgi:hypothetical protein